MISRAAARRGIAAASLLLAAASTHAQDDDDTTAELRRVRDGVKNVEAAVRELSAGVKHELGTVRDRLSLTLASTFLQAPPMSSDSVGVARVSVFGPRLELDSFRRRDTLMLRVRRMEPMGLRRVGPDLEVGSGEAAIALPVDQNGALYVMEWWTSEGDTYSVQLRDGATGLPAATVQVRPQQNRGRFLYVAYRLE